MKRYSLDKRQIRFIILFSTHGYHRAIIKNRRERENRRFLKGKPRVSRRSYLQAYVIPIGDRSPICNKPKDVIKFKIGSGQDHHLKHNISIPEPVDPLAFLRHQQTDLIIQVMGIRRSYQIFNEILPISDLSARSGHFKIA